MWALKRTENHSNHQEVKEVSLLLEGALVASERVMVSGIELAGK
jgi:hypothetical protein